MFSQQLNISHSKVCLPTIVKDCGPVALKERRVIPIQESIVQKCRKRKYDLYQYNSLQCKNLEIYVENMMQVEGKESCVDVARTVCTEVS